MKDSIPDLTVSWLHSSSAVVRVVRTGELAEDPPTSAEGSKENFPGG